MEWWVWVLIILASISVAGFLAVRAGFWAPTKQAVRRALWWLLPISFVAAAALVLWHSLAQGLGVQQDGGLGVQQDGGRSKKTCGTDPAAAKTCGAQDPVSDPDYNMREIVKQSILLEEHLVEKNKRCKDCIVKHFLHIIGLAEEAQSLAGSKLNKYPLMAESPEFYRRQYERWLALRDDDATYRKVDDKLRKHRKQLVAHYILNGGEPVN